MEEVKVSKTYLKYIVQEYAKALVGRIYRRYEVLTEEEAKKVIKELIYEHSRDLITCLEAFSKGIGVEFKRPN